MKIACLRETWEPMACVSGFDPLIAAMSAIMESDLKSFFVPRRNKKSMFYTLKEAWNTCCRMKDRVKEGYPQSPFVQREHDIVGRKMIRYAQKEANALLFLSAGENQFGTSFSNLPRALKKKIVIVLHQPPSWLRSHWRDFTSLNNLASIICLSREQEEFVSNVCNTPVIRIRHGVCHDFFRPLYNYPSEGKPRLIFVGKWLRDFETFSKTLGLVWRQRPDVEIDVVVTGSVKKREPALKALSGDTRVGWHSEINAEALRDMYQGSTLLFLPLIDATANNTIVEAMASGLPVITSKVGGVVEYVSEKTGELCQPRNAVAHANAVCDWLSNPKRCKKASVAARNFATNFLDWEKIAKGLLADLQQAARC